MRIAILLMAVTACATSVDPPPCRNDVLDATFAAIADLPEGERPAALLHGIGEACDDPQLGALFDVPGSGRAAAVTHYAKAHPKRWKAGCPAGATPLAELAPLPAAQRTAKLHELCDLQRFSWSVTRSRIMGERVPVGILVAGRLSTSDPARQRRALDILAGK